MTSSESQEPAQTHAIAQPVASRLVCHGCGHQPPLDEAHPYRCRRAELGDNVDHVLRRVFDAETFTAKSNPRQTFLDPESNPFRKFRRLFYSYEIARLGGIPDTRFLRMVDRIDTAIAAVDGRGFRTTPFGLVPELARALDLEPERLWVKDETGNVSGSHKGRHLMGLLLWLEVVRALDGTQGEAPLAIASCGNAALAAAVLAQASGRALEVFVPPDANPRTRRRLGELGALLVDCPRRDSDPAGDPCYLRFVEARERGALPFTVQGNSNGLAIEGGATLAWEMVSTWTANSAEVEHLVIQVGGGALAASCIAGLRDALELGLIARLPRIHTVQTASGYPLRRAYDQLAARLLPAGASTLEPSSEFDVAAGDTRALRIRDQAEPGGLDRELSYATHHRSEFMRAWETQPRSIAYGILDDETYDWVAVLEGMLETGGIPLVASEDRLREAHGLARTHTAIAVEPTGTAGLAGLLDLQRAGVVKPHETVAVLFTGAER